MNLIHKAGGISSIVDRIFWVFINIKLFNLLISCLFNVIGDWIAQLSAYSFHHLKISLLNILSRTLMIPTISSVVIWVEVFGGEGSQLQGTAANPPRLVQHIFYSAVKMAASEGARSCRTSVKRSWNASDLSESRYPWGVNSCPDTIWITGIDTIAVTPRFCHFIVKSRVGGFHW